MRAATTATTATETAMTATGWAEPMPKLAPVFRTSLTATTPCPSPGRAEATPNLLS